MLAILLLYVAFCIRYSRAFIHTAVFKNQNPGVPHSISRRKMLQCCAEALESNYTGVSVNKLTEECFKILNNGNLPANPGDYKTMLKTRNKFTLIPQV